MRAQSYDKIRQRLQNVAKEKKFPLHVMFELTYRCNFRCRHCYIPTNYRERKELGTADVFSIIDQLVDIGCLYLGFTGGEPFIRDDMLDILWYAKKKGFQVIIYTNGSLIDKERADELARLRPNKVDITVPAMSEEVFEKISGVPGSRDKVFGTIDSLYKAGVNLGLKTCVLKENEDEIKGIDDLAASLNVSYRLDDILMPRLDGSKEPYKYRGKAPYAVCPRPKGVPSGVDRKHESLLKCGVGVNQAAITPLGELKMCLMMDHSKYNILKSSFEKAWKELRNMVEDRYFTTGDTECRHCSELIRKCYEK